MPNLENLKKQAKQYLRWHRDGYFPVAARIRSVLPRYRQLADREIMASRFTLTDAQELIARASGYESWPALREGVRSMSDARKVSVPRPVLLAAEPQLFVSDVAASCEYYTKTLGFAVAFTYGEPPFYGQVVRDGARLNLRAVATHLRDPELIEAEHLLSASITVDEVKPLYLEYQDAGAAFHQTLRTEPWGARTFVVRDPDGNLVLFAGD